MADIHRRTFFIKAIAAGSLLATATTATQAQAKKLEESDPQATALGYKHDTKQVDKAKYPKHDDSQTCSNCQLYQGKPDDPFAGCAIFAGKQVAGPGWCSAWIKKAG